MIHHCRHAAVVPVLALLLALPASADQLEPVTPVAVDLQQILAQPQIPDPAAGEAIEVGDHVRVSEEELAALRAAALRLPPSDRVHDGLGGGEAPNPGVAFDGPDATQCCGGGGITPPDPALAAGPNHLIAVVNVAFIIYNKTGTPLVGPTTFSSFLAPLGGACAGGPFDPTAVYDEESGRFVMVVDGNGTHFCVAASQTGDPTGGWWLYAIPAQPVGGEFHDYPHTGIGDSFIVVGGNQFGGAIPGGFEGRIWALNKSTVYAGGAVTPVTASLTANGGTPQPLNLHGFGQGTWPALGSTHYVVSDPYDGCNVDIWRWNIPAAPTVVSSFNLCTATGVTAGMPVNFPQQTGGAIQANDFRNRGFEYRNGSGWFADSIGCNPGGGTVDCVRFSETNLMANPPTLVQAGVFASAGDYRTFPDLAVDAAGNMAVGYTKSNTSSYPGIFYTGRKAGDPAGTLEAEAMLRAGDDQYNSFDGTPYRWGDYTEMTIDPDGVTFWYLGEYSKAISAPAEWGTYIGSFSYPSVGVGLCSTPALAIPDNNPVGVTDSLMPPSGGTLLDLDVSLDVTHTWVGDLAFTVTHDDTATSATIVDRPGEPASTFGCSGNDILATLDDEAGSPVESQCGAGTPTISGSFTPNNPLTVFDGEDLAGTWTITVSDNAGGDTGTLDEWCLVPTVDPMPFLDGFESGDTSAWSSAVP